MADEITKCVCFQTNGSTDRHVVHYRLESGENSTEISVSVSASEMTDPEDVAELKTLANAKAASVKATWEATLAVTKTEAEHNDPGLIGEVTL